ncbi:MAG: cysteinyl-tRNA synthetase, partial [Candidatus Aminicenantes bacterium]|nr:cysteinyl-tRNA synthetase [Candidatus Aminicenantes bacterium]
PVWETRIGPGRPGWHIECSAMSSKYLGRTFDIHCGGVDNIFPHHENEIAQSEAANGVKFVNYWVHGHHLVVDGEKMSKSKGNFYTLTDILARGYDPLDVRYLLVATHYRKMLNFTFEALDQARTARRRIGNFLGELRAAAQDGPSDPAVVRMVDEARAGFVAGLEDDLNISEALAAVFTLIKSAYPLLQCGGISGPDALTIASFFAEVDEVVAVKPAPLPQEQLEAEILNKIEARQKARAARDFKRADGIRDELLEAGIVLEDTKDGVRWKKAGPPKS